MIKALRNLPFIGGAFNMLSPQDSIKMSREEVARKAVNSHNAPKAMKKGGVVRGDGCCIKGHTKGTMR